MKIQIGGLSDGIHRYRFEVPTSLLGLSEQFVNDVVTDVTLDKSSNQILLKASIQATAHCECDRCVSVFDAKLTPSYSMVYVTEGDDTAGLDSTEVQVIPNGLHIIDITEDVRQTTVLSIPLKLLCKETCRGLCSECGQNLNEGTCACSEAASDSRWEGLRKLQSN
ncbi:MAG: DUF177 domain-containing protein [bacterium]